jgi:hypothetical protein
VGVAGSVGLSAGMRVAFPWVFITTEEIVQKFYQISLTLLSITRACHGLPLYALRAATPLHPAGRAACGRLLPPWTPHAVRLWVKMAPTR